MNIKKFTLSLCLSLVFLAFTAKAQKVELKTTNYPIPSTGVVLYVAPEDDDNPGKTTNTGTSPSSPWTLTKAFLEAPANAAVIVRGGEYRSVNLIRITNKITVQAYPGEKPWIKGSIVVSNWEKVEGMDVWVHANWPYEFPKNTVPQNIGTNPLADNRDMVFVNDQSLTQVDSLTKVGTGKFYVDYAGDKLYIGTNPATGKIESTRYTSPLIRNTPTGGEIRVPNGTTIKGIGFTHYADEGLEVVCFGGLRLEDNTFVWNGVAGAGLVAPTAVIKGNTFAYNGNVGLQGNNLKETVVEDNHAYQNNIERYSTSWAAAGIKVIATKQMKIRRNVVEDNYAAGIWLDISAIDNEVTYNTVKENNGFGVFSELSNGTIIAGNLLIDNKNYAIAISDGDSSQVWNNTIVSNAGRGFFVKDSPREAKDVAPGSTFYGYISGNLKECSWITRANVIKNNLVVTNTGLWMENTQPSVLQVRESDYNGYYRTATTDGNVYKWNNINYTTLDAFKTAVPGYESNSIAFYKQSSHPFFFDTTYRLKANSPAIKAGAPLPQNIALLLGLPAGNQQVDMGAIQTTAPAAPSHLVATVLSQRTISLSWTDNADNEEGYKVERATGRVFVTVANLEANATTFKERGLTAGTAYQYRVTAYNSAGAASAEVNLNAMPQLYRSSLSQADEIVSQSRLNPATPAPTYGSLKENPEVKLYPNPASRQIMLSFDSKEREPVKVSVTNTVNAVVLTYNGTATKGGNKITLNISSLQTGIYVVMLQTGNTTLQKLLIVR